MKRFKNDRMQDKLNIAVFVDYDNIEIGLKSTLRREFDVSLALDALKATLAIVLAWWLFGPPTALAAAAGAILGHMYPIWLKFHGGKGVATYLGGLIGLAWPAAIVFAIVWLAVAALTRYSSAAALAATVASPIAMAAIGESGAALAFAALSALIWFKHSANIVRLLNGSESKIGQKN